MKKQIENVGDLGQQWVLMGVPNGDLSLFSLTDFQQNCVQFVRCRVTEADGTTHDLVHIIAAGSYTKTPEFGDLLNALEKGGLAREITTVSKGDLLAAIHKEWLQRLKTGSVDIKQYQKEEVDPDNIREVNDIILEAIRDGVSDIHLEVKESYGRIRRRVNGRLESLPEFGREHALGLCRTVFNVLTTKESPSYFKANQVQDAAIDDEFDGLRVRGRIASGPTVQGNTIVIRLAVQAGNQAPKTTEQMRYSPTECASIKRATNRPQGIFIMAGTTGSGKTTSIFHILRQKDLDTNGEINIITVEEPVENILPNANQFAVPRSDDGDAEAGLQTVLRNSMRQDPDLLYIGEIRDDQTAAVALAAANTGHLAFSTLHAGGAVECFTRLEDLGMDKDVLAAPSFIAGFVFQKLLPVVCPKCCKSVQDGRIPQRATIGSIIKRLKLLSDDQLKLEQARYSEQSRPMSFVRYLQDRRVINATKAELIVSQHGQVNSLEDQEALKERLSAVCDIEREPIRFRGDGCANCRYTGISSRIITSESLVPDTGILKLVSESRTAELHSYWTKSLGGVPIIEDGIQKMRQGHIDPYILEEYLQQIGS